MSIKAAVSMFTEFKVLPFIRECFDIFHVEGDYAILDDIILDDIIGYLNNKGVHVDEGIS